MNILMDPCQLGGLPKGTRFLKENESQLNQLAPGAVNVVMDWAAMPGGRLVVVAPDHSPGKPPHPDTFRMLDYALRVRPIK